MRSTSLCGISSTLGTLTFPGILCSLFRECFFDLGLWQNIAATSHFAHVEVVLGGGGWAAGIAVLDTIL